MAIKGECKKLNYYGLNNLEPKFRLTSFANDTCVDNLYNLTISPKGTLLTAQRDSTLFIWNSSTGALMDTLNLPAIMDQSQISENEDLILFAKYSDGNIALLGYDVKSKKRWHSTIPYDIALPKIEYWLNSISISPNNKIGLLSCTNHEFIIIDLVSKKLIYRILHSVPGYIHVDADGHFDGSQSAINQAFYLKGQKAYSFHSLPETSFEKGLVYKIRHNKLIRAKSIQELQFENKKGMQ